jgi:hypothetical protein
MEVAMGVFKELNEGHSKRSFCTEGNCTNPAEVRGMCRYHYNRWYRNRDNDDDEWRRPNVTRERHGDDRPFRHPGNELLRLMQDWEDKVKVARDAQGKVKTHLEAHPDLALLWNDFENRGGSTSADLRQWLIDDDWHRKDVILRKQHLRLVSSRSLAVRKPRRRESLKED